MPPNYTKCEEAETIGRKLLDSLSEFEAIRNETIVYVCSDKPLVTRGATALGTCQVISGKHAYLYWSAQGERFVRPFFLITLSPSYDLWPDEVKRFVIRHELRHCGIEIKAKGKKRRYTKPHDFELFFPDLYDPCLETVKEVLRQARNPQIVLPLEDREYEEAL